MAMMIIETAIVEDDAAAKADLTHNLETYAEEANLAFHFSYFTSGEDFLRSYKPHLFQVLFLDIELGEGHDDGMSVARKLRQIDEKLILIFVTNIRRYVMEGYEVGALNYILKPVHYFSLKLTLEKVREILKINANDSLLVKSQKAIVKIPRESIYFLEISKHDIVIHTVSGPVHSYGSLKELEDDLLSYDFFKINNYALINLNKITTVEGLSIKMADGTTLYLSRRRKKEFLSALMAFYGRIL